MKHTSRIARLGGLAAVVAGFLMSMTAQADVFTDADNLYAQREVSRTKIQEARAKYVALLPQLAGPQLIRAVSQLGRLALFEGEMVLPKDETSERKRIFRECWENFAEKIKPAAVGENPAYYYFKGMCLAYWGESAGPLASLPYVSTLIDMINRGLAGDTRFEGGGIFRVGAGVYSNKKAQPLGLYKPNEALALIDKALLADAYPGDPSSGSAYYDNWRGKALVLAELGRDAEVITLDTAKIAEIEALEADDDLPRGREPETRWNKAQMQQQLEDLN